MYVAFEYIFFLIGVYFKPSLKFWELYSRKDRKVNIRSNFFFYLESSPRVSKLCHSRKPATREKGHMTGSNTFVVFREMLRCVRDAKFGQSPLRCVTVETNLERGQISVVAVYAENLGVKWLVMIAEKCKM